MQNCAIVEAFTFWCISVWLNDWVVRLELLECVGRSHLKNDDHECSHEECRVGQLVWFVWTIVEYAAVLVLLILKNLGRNKVPGASELALWHTCASCQGWGVQSLDWMGNTADPMRNSVTCLNRLVYLRYQYRRSKMRSNSEEVLHLKASRACLQSIKS
jgi:hypothetical protein